MPTKTWTVSTPGETATRTLTHEQMMTAMFEAIHGNGFKTPLAAAPAQRIETREKIAA